MSRNWRRSAPAPPVAADDPAGRLARIGTRELGQRSRPAGGNLVPLVGDLPAHDGKCLDPARWLAEPADHEVLHHGRTAPCGVEQCADGEGQGHDEGGQHQERHDGHGDAPAAASQPLHANHRRPRGHDDGRGPDECPEKRQERPEAAKEQQPDQQHHQDDPGDVAGRVWIPWHDSTAGGPETDLPAGVQVPSRSNRSIFLNA